MNKKLASIGVALVAMLGFGLAAFIPAASAHKIARDVCDPYVETCPPVAPPSSPGTTTTTSSTTTTTASTTTTTASTTTSTPSTTTSTPSTTTAAPTVYVGTITANPTIPPGTLLGPGIGVAGVGGGDVTIDDNGTFIKVPDGSVVTAEPGGPLVIASTSGKYGLVTVQLIGAKASKLYLVSALGSSFGVDHSAATILKYLKFYNGSKADKGKITSLSEFHGRLHITLATAATSPKVQVSSAVLEYTKAEVKYIKAHHVKTLAESLTVTTTAGTSYTTKFAVPVTELKVAPSTTKK